MNEVNAVAAAELLLRQVAEMETMLARLTKFCETQRRLAMDLQASALTGKV